MSSNFNMLWIFEIYDKFNKIHVLQGKAGGKGWMEIPGLSWLRYRLKHNLGLIM